MKAAVLRTVELICASGMSRLYDGPIDTAVKARLRIQSSVNWTKLFHSKGTYLKSEAVVLANVEWMKN